MAYSKNIKLLALGLCSDGHSPEDVENILSEMAGHDREEGFSSLCKMAGSLSVPFTEADWRELEQIIPTAHTIRSWLSRTKSETPKQELELVEPLPDTETARLKQIQQIEHIAKLQQLAKSVREDVDQVSMSDSDQLLDGEYIDLLLIAYTLVNNALWVWLAPHLGNEARKIETVAGVLSESAPLKKVPLEDRRRQIREARQSLKSALYPVAIYGNPKEWEEYGLNAKCPGCYQ